MHDLFKDAHFFRSKTRTIPLEHITGACVAIYSCRTLCGIDPQNDNLKLKVSHFVQPIMVL